jgi:DNA-binding GntR family transcriptional regulator
MLQFTNVSKVVKLQKEPLTRRAVQAIRAAIFAGEFTSGQRMVEEELSESLGVSRNVIREAFWQLEAQGLLQSDDYKGKSVASLTVEDIADLIPLRLAIESLAAMWAARHITSEGAELLRAQAKRFLEIRDTKNFSDYAEADFELHYTIWRLSGNSQLLTMLDRLAGPMIALQSRICLPVLPELIAKEQEVRESSHAAIVEAICTGDAIRARSAMQKHILAFWSTWLSHASTPDHESVHGSREAIDDALQLVSVLGKVLEQERAAVQS